MSQRPLAYFTKTSPDFVNSRGQVIKAQQQVDALAKAQSIGKSPIRLRVAPMSDLRVPSLLVDLHHPMFQRLCSQGQVQHPLRQASPPQPVQLLRHRRRSLLGHVHHLHPPIARRLWRNLQAFAALLAHPDRLRVPLARLVVIPCRPVEERIARDAC